MTTSRPWKGQPYLDELRPPPGRKVDLALFATYSLDLSALGAALLALVGRGDDAGGGSVADFATALESLRDTTRFLVQRGRIARPTRLPTLAGVLDQFVVELPFDEVDRSWHPKVALVRYVPEQQKGKADDPVWRVWLGSRNLTSGGDLEVGLLLESVAGSRKVGRSIDGIGRVGALLAERASLPELDPEALAAQLERARWIMPQGIEVASVHVAAPGEPLQVGPPAGDIDEITVLSPFLDATFLKRVASWGGASTRRTLVSTRRALAAVAGARGKPLSAFTDVLALDAPDPPLECADDPATDAPAPPTTKAERDDADHPPPSLHAKLFQFTTRDRATMLMGSANATSRAWAGRNVEVLAELRGGAELVGGISHIVGGGVRVDVAEIEARAAPDTDPLDVVEDARRRLAASMIPKLSRADEAFTLDLGVAPILNEGISLHVGLATSEALALPTGASSIALGRVPVSRQTDLVRFRLASAEAAVAWMQRAAVDPPLDAERDAATLSSVMGFGAFQIWMRQLLSGDPTADDGPRWDQQDERTAHGERDGPEPERLTLEDVVGSWGADKERFKRADAHFRRYADALLGRPDVLSPAERETLEELRAIWRLARERLPS